MVAIQASACNHAALTGGIIDEPSIVCYPENDFSFRR
jgi:hypothetical protein